MEMLHISRCVKFVSTVNRPNLFYMVWFFSVICLPSIFSGLLIYELILYFLKLQVREKSSVGKVVIDEIAEFIQESYTNNESGIVYCFSRKECEQVRFFQFFLSFFRFITGITNQALFVVILLGACFVLDQEVLEYQWNWIVLGVLDRLCS